MVRPVLAFETMRVRVSRTAIVRNSIGARLRAPRLSLDYRMLVRVMPHREQTVVMFLQNGGFTERVVGVSLIGLRERNALVCERLERLGGCGSGVG
jgi:hypothetical protein